MLVQGIGLFIGNACATRYWTDLIAGQIFLQTIWIENRTLIYYHKVTIKIYSFFSFLWYSILLTRWKIEFIMTFIFKKIVFHLKSNYLQKRAMISRYLRLSKDESIRYLGRTYNISQNLVKMIDILELTFLCKTGSWCKKLNDVPIAIQIVVL